MQFRNQKGFMLVSTLIYSLVAGMIIVGTYQLLDHRVDALKIIRMQERMRLLEQKLINTARSRAAIKLTSNRNPGTTLASCIKNQDCRARGIFEPVVLYDALGQRLSGQLDLNGRPCKGSCPIEIQAEIQIICGEGESSCAQAGEIQTRYSIRKSSDGQFKGRKFPPLEGLASLAAFVCPANQYIRAISAEGQLGCAALEASVNDIKCPAGTASIGLDAAGFLKCMPIKDLCSKDISLAAVLDVSLSMDGERLRLASDALGDFVGKMKKSDERALSTFWGGSGLVKPLGSNFVDMAGALKGLQTKPATNLAAGLEEGGKSLSGYKKGSERVMVFISDGFSNTGPDPLREAERLKSEGIRIVTVGFSTDTDKFTMQKIATSPSDYYDVANINDIRKALDQVSSMICR